MTNGLRNNEPFWVRVEFLSDWACATGSGRHHAVDSVVSRDADNLPMLPGKTLSGMLRDAAETVARGLDDGVGSGLWQRWTTEIFGGQTSAGAPAVAALRGSPLYIATGVRAGINRLHKDERELVREAMLLVRPGVAIDKETGTAKHDMLRIEERASVGLVLEAQWRLAFPFLGRGEPVPWEVEILLLAAARMVDSIGGNRRRGAGRCVVTIDVPGGDGQSRLNALLDKIDDAREPAVIIRTPTLPPATSLGQTAPSAILRHRYDLSITALTPVMAPRTAIGSMILTETYLRGQLLLPLVAHALGSRSTDLITGNRVVITDATLEIEGRRSLPMPRALRQVKDGDSTELVNILRLNSGEDRRLSRVDGYYAATEGGHAVRQPSLVIRAHAAIDDRAQRPTDEAGLYMYEALAVGTVLRAQLWLPDGVSINESLAGRHRLGRSNKDDYGQVEIEVLPATVEATSSEVAGDGELVVWLLSDVLLRGDAGEPAADAETLSQQLSHALGVKLTLVEALLSHRRIESWQRRWGLPRPSLTGLVAGSVARFTMHDRPTDEAWMRVQANGIGERTVEGFGRVLLNPPLLAEASVRCAVSTGDQTPVALADPGETDQGMVDELRLRGWLRDLTRCARARAQDRVVRDAVVPRDMTAAQLGILRTFAERLGSDGDPAPMREWLDSAQKDRRRSFVEKEFLSRLRRLTMPEDNELWRLLKCTPPSELREELRLPALATLLVEVCRSTSNGRDGE